MFSLFYVIHFGSTGGGLSSSYQKKNDEKPSAEKVAEDMDFFSIELLKGKKL